MSAPEPHRSFNPLDRLNLGDSVANALLSRPTEPLPPAKQFHGAGVYAIYYCGAFPLYAPLRTRPDAGPAATPIYVGKAIPPGARQGGLGIGAPAGRALYSRLVEHARSIDAVASLTREDFRVRFLVTEDIWIPLAEQLLIERFRPLWNTILTGFGNHPVGKGRTSQRRSRWDEFHPGRAWADGLNAPDAAADQLVKLVARALRERTDRS